MKTLKTTAFLLATFALCISCGKSTEKYASKEHGMKFDAWELNYNADDDDIYWPSVVLTESTEGEIVEIKSWRDLWYGSSGSDTTRTGAVLQARIYNYKSRNDAKYHNAIKFKTGKADNTYRSGLEHHFLFNGGQADSVSFTAKSNNDHYFIPDQETSDRIIELLSGKDSVTITVTFKGPNGSYSTKIRSIEGSYSYKVTGSPKLTKALEINHQRRVLAEKESKKAEERFEKELDKLFDEDW